MRSNQIVCVAVERAHVGFAGDDGLGEPARREQRTDGRREQASTALARVWCKQCARGLIARLRVLDRVREALAEYVVEFDPRRVGADHDIAPVHRLAAVRGSARHRRREQRRLRGGERIRIAADERAAEVGPRPERGHGIRGRIVDRLSGHACAFDDPLEQGAPGRRCLRVDRVHAGVGDQHCAFARERGYAYRSRWPIPNFFALASIAAPSAMSDSDSPRCQKRFVSSSRSRPGLRPATISPSSA